MANKTLFQSVVGKLIPRATVRNEAGGKAYQLTAKQALAQYTATGCLNRTFYAGAETQLQEVLMAAIDVAGDDPAFVAQCAVYMREKMYMKDVPALLLALLTVEHGELAEHIFGRVIDNGKMLRNFVQIMRSGAVPRKSLGTRPKRMVREWLAGRDEEWLFRQSVGQSPSMADIIKMVHPKPATEKRAAFYGYLLGKDVDAEALPDLVQQYEAYKALRQAGSRRAVPPKVPFQMVQSLGLDREDWKQVARDAGWQMTRMNLNTFARHGVLTDARLVRTIAKRLADKEEIKKARVFPYQLMTAYKNAWGMPRPITDALQDAMEVALQKVPRIDGDVAVCIDVSGSMQSPVTGYRRGSTTAVRCLDVAALFGAAMVRKNNRARLIPFHDRVVEHAFNPRDTVLTIADGLTKIPSGGTNCAAPLEKLVRDQARVDLVVMVSDCESWVDAGIGRGTRTMEAWRILSARNPGAKLVCIDIQPYGTVQAQNAQDILNVGGFSDEVFNVVARFAQGDDDTDGWVRRIERVTL